LLLQVAGSVFEILHRREVPGIGTLLCAGVVA
jgi:hypothetical protein